jgi:prepilin-type N-terminal cleavage/methylation domain-containing protein/prepilin-type processing-associated H-X9-DG protein
MKCRSKTSGFTLVELLVVITIIGILIALLLPAVQAAREAARRAKCSNNFKQVGVALHSYHQARNSFPPGSFNSYATAPSPECGLHITASYSNYGWGAQILPYVELQTIFDRLSWTNGGYSNASAQESKTRIDTYLCPSDPQDGELVMPNDKAPTWLCRQTNMAGVADSNNWCCYSDLYPKQYPIADGVMADLKGCSTDDIKDGLSNTLMIGEGAGGGRDTHIGFFWASWNVADTGLGINNPVTTVPGGGKWDTTNDNGSFSSFHPGGCHFLMCDGSVAFLSQNISQNYLAALTTRDGERVNSNGAPDKILVSGPP